MAWIFAIIGLILGSVIGLSNTGISLCILLGLVISNTINLYNLRKKQNIQDNVIKKLLKRLMVLEINNSHKDSSTNTDQTQNTYTSLEEELTELANQIKSETTKHNINSHNKTEFNQHNKLIVNQNAEQPLQSTSVKQYTTHAHAKSVNYDEFTSTYPTSKSANNWFNIAKNWLLSGNLVLKIGLVLLFLGLTFLLGYVAEHIHAQIPISVRYLLVACFGISLIALGLRLRSAKRDYSLLIQGAGIGIVYLTIFTALHLHHLLNNSQAFFLLVLLTLLCVGLSLWQNAISLAIAAILGGFAAPILTAGDSGSHIILFSYFTLLNLGIFAIAWFKAWRMLNLIGFLGTFLIGLTWGIRSYRTELFISTEFFLLLSFAIYLSIALLFSRKRLLDADNLSATSKRIELVRWGLTQTNYIDISLLFGVPLSGFGLQCAVVAHFEFGAAYSALMLGLIYLALARLIANKNGRLTLLIESCLALGMIFISLVFPLAFDARWTSATWAIQGAGIYWIAIKTMRPLARTFAVLLQIGALLAFLYDLNINSYTSLLGGASPLGALMLGVASLFIFWQQRKTNSNSLCKWEIKFHAYFAVFGLCFLYLIAPLWFLSTGTAIYFALAGLITLLIGIYLSLTYFLWSAIWVQLIGSIIFIINNPIIFLIKFSNGNVISLIHSSFLVSGALALVALLSAWLLHQTTRQTFSLFISAKLTSPTLKLMSRFLLSASLLWWILISIIETCRFTPQIIERTNLLLLITTSSVLLWTLLALRTRWTDLARISLALTPIAWWLLLTIIFENYQPLAGYGLIAWLSLFSVHGWMLWQLEHSNNLLRNSSLHFAHLFGCWLLLAITWQAINHALISFSYIWQVLGNALIPNIFLLLMASKNIQIWPFTNWEKTYRLKASIPIASILTIWLWLAGILSDGNAKPIPYLPLFNPLEIGLLITVCCIFYWAQQILIKPKLLTITQQNWLFAGFGLSLLMLLSMLVCRGMHHFMNVPFNLHDLSKSMTVQAGISLIWSLTALTLMISGSLRNLRIIWIIGATLMSVVVIKLFMVELVASGTLARVISFISVGVLLLIVGYFAPLPTRDNLQNQTK